MSRVAIRPLKASKSNGNKRLIRVEEYPMTTITPSTTVRELLEAHPSVFQVMLGHGMCASCQQDPPDVPLSHFAQKHCGGNLAGLIQELETAALSA
jgi:hypothetical protein